MKNRILLLSFIALITSCSTKNESLESVERNNRFIHLIDGCDNKTNPEINCYEFIEFVNDSIADILIGGGDIVLRTKYEINNDKIILEQIESINSGISFNIQDETTLIRIEDTTIWSKEEE